MNNITIKKVVATEEVLDIKLVDLMCKHILSIDNPVAEKVLSYSNDDCGYAYCLWGIHNGHKGDLDYHISSIRKMEEESFHMPIRIVKCKYPFSDKTFYWADNLHNTVKAVREHGKDATLRNIDFYIVGISDLWDVQLVSYNDSLRENFADVFGAIKKSYARYSRSNSKRLIELKYTVGDLLRDNPNLYEFGKDTKKEQM